MQHSHRGQRGARRRPTHLRKTLLAATAAVLISGYAGRNEADSGAPGAHTADVTQADLIEQGRYLARAGNCGPCHTRQDGAAMAGGVAFQTPFGTVHSTNITPDVATGIGAWTLDQFRRALREGVRPNGEHLYPVFPYTAFTRISDADAAALYAYLMSLPAASAPPAENALSFPFDQRWLLGGWKLLYLDSGPYLHDPRQSVEWNRGAYLVTGLAHCSACHSPRNLLGAERTGLGMTGGVLVKEVAEGVHRPWSAPNLTPASSGLGAWSTQELASYLKTGANAYITTFGPMNDVIMHGVRHLSDADTHAMAVYLKSLPAREGRHGPAAEAAAVKNGQAVYDAHCGTCHQPDGMGAPDSGPRLAGSPVVQAEDPATLINNILYGPTLPDPAPRPRRWRQMEGFSEDIGDDDIADLASYLRSAWNNKGGAVTAEQVARQRY